LGDNILFIDFDIKGSRQEIFLDGYRGSNRELSNIHDGETKLNVFSFIQG